MFDLFEGFVSIIKWIKIFLSPFLLFGFAGVVLMINTEDAVWEYTGIGLIISGFILGVILAEYIRKKHGLIEFDSKVESSADIDKWLEKEREKYKKEKK